jgi:glyoxalase family protein
VTLLLDSAQKTAAILTDVFGFREVAREGSVIRFAAAGDVKGNVIDICEAAGVLRGHQGRGSVHHIAFRAVDEVQQAQMTEKLIRTHGRHPTEQKDRKYFRSIYFREPGGVLFEIATDIPGFAVDEPIEALGRDLELPTFSNRVATRSRACCPFSRRLRRDERVPYRFEMTPTRIPAPADSRSELMNLQEHRRDAGF